jgi:8-hydroxy-5-deazaflavin:NADPH oxidoreductase
VLVRVGVLGGTGPAGRALAARLADSGCTVVIGSRDADRAVEIRDKVLSRWPGRELPIEAADNTGAASAELVVVATPWDSAAETAASLATELEDKVVISMANALTKGEGGFHALVPARGSVAAGVQAAIPGSLVSAAFHHLPAKTLGDLDVRLDADVLVCADAPEATAATSELIERVPGLRALDAGGLHSAMPVESLTAVLLQLNIRYKAKAGVRITGIE